MIYGSVCSGIEAATVAWEPLGWHPAWFAEIDAFPSAVLKHHYPTVPNLGDFTTIGAKHGPIDLLVGGTPCQSFSVAGLRGGMADERGNLALEYLRLLDRLRPRWMVWENVPGVLSSSGGRDFGAFLGGLAELGYGWSYRVLDAQFFGVPQRRRRVFVVGCADGWQRAAAVLFERHSLSGHPAPRRSTGQVAPTVPASGAGTSRTGNDRTEHEFLVSATVSSKWAKGTGGPSGDEVQNLVTAYACQGTNVGEMGALKRGNGHVTGGVPFLAFSSKDYGADASELSPTLRAMGHAKSHANSGGQVAVAFAWHRTQMDVSEVSPTVTVSDSHAPAVMSTNAVRRLTPIECERLQGFPDDHTNVPYRGKPAADGPRYKAIGNSMAVPVMRWIGERIQQVEDML